MPWKFFVGACFLTGALLIPHGGKMPVLAGMGLAALVNWAWSRLPRFRRPDAPVTDAPAPGVAPAVVMLSSRRFLTGAAFGAAALVAIGRVAALPLWLLGAEVLATIL